MERYHFNSTLVSMLIAFAFLISIVSLFDQWIKSPPSDLHSLFILPFISTLCLLAIIVAFFYLNKNLKREFKDIDKFKAIYDGLYNSNSQGLILATTDGEILIANHFANQLFELYNSSNINIFELVPSLKSIVSVENFIGSRETVLNNVKLKQNRDETFDLSVKEVEFDQQTALLVILNSHPPKSEMEILYETVLNTVDAAIVLVDNQEQCVYWNKAFLNTSKIKEEDLVSNKFLDVLLESEIFSGIPQERKLILKEALRDVFASGNISSIPQIIQGTFLKNQHLHNFFKKIFKIQLENNRHLIGAVFIDITELVETINKISQENIQLEQQIQEKIKEIENNRKELIKLNEELANEIETRRKVEEELRKSQELYTNLINNLPIGVYRSNLNGNILLANPALAKILGCNSIEELLNTSAFEFYKARENRDKVLQFHALSKEKLQKVETEMITKDGRQIFVYDFGCSVPEPNTGEVFFDGVIIDVTDKYLIQKELEKSEKKLRQLFESVNEVLFQLDEDGKIELVSPSVEEILGFSPKRLLETNFANLLENPEWFSKVINILKERNTARNILLEFKTSNRNTKYLKGDYFYIEEDNGRFAIEALLRDVTEEIENQNFLSSMFTIFRTFNEERHLFEIADNIIKALQYITIVPNFIFGVFDEESNSIRIVKHNDRFGNRFFRLNLSETNHPIIDSLRKQKVSIYTEKELEDFWFDKRYQTPSMLITMPLTCQTSSLGIIGIYTYGQEMNLSKTNLYHLSSLAEQISIGLERKLLADKLKIQLALFETLVESIPYPICYRDLKAKTYRFCNSAFEVFAEKPRTEIIGKKIEEIFKDELAKTLYQRDEEIRLTKQMQVFELIKEDAHGNKKIYISIRSPILLEELKEEAVVGILIDITERKTYEEELQKALNFNQLILDIVPSAIFTIDTNRNITSWNKYAETITGYTAEEVVGNKCFLCEGIKNFDKCEIIERYHQDIPIEKTMKFISKDGKELTLSKKALSLKDKDGNILGGIEVFDDITSKIEFEQRLAYIAETNSRLATISSLATNVQDKETLLDILLPVALQITNSEGVCFIELIRTDETYSITSILDLKFTEKNKIPLLIPLEKFINTYLGKIMIDRDIITIENAEKDKLLSELDFLQGKRLIEIPLTSGEEVMAILIVYGKERPYSNEEISSLDRLSQIFATNVARINYQNELQNLLVKQIQINELQTNFINLISHEYRTPLQAVVLSAEILKKHFDRLTPEQKEQQFKRIEKAIKDMNNMLENVILYNKLSRPVEEVSLEVVNSKVFFESLVNDFLLYYQETAKIKYKINTKVEKVKVDFKLLQLIFSNLISNAVKYSQPNPVIDIEIDVGKDWINLKFSDNGIGIDPKDLPNIFEPFYRGKNIKTISGTGLGLSIVRNAIELLGGKINVSSKVGEGTTFEVQLPAA
ncbi:MAG: PAS domain S-box protein [Candidatus Kapaibacteriota bacterium]